MKMNRLYIWPFLLFLAIFSFANLAEAQKKGTDVSATIVDEQGVPISGVDIFAPNGIHVITDVNGKFDVKVMGNKPIILEKEGYDTKSLFVLDITNEIVLKKSLFLNSDKDVIKMGIRTTTRRKIVGAVSLINPNDHLTYDNTQWVRDYIDGYLLGLRGAGNIRGLGNALFVIDGVIGRNPNLLRMEEVEQITVLKDANAVALYGSQAQNGVIIINTKRGEINKKQARVNVSFGLKKPISYPKYLGSADYMTLYNEATENDFIRSGSPSGDLPFSEDDIENFRSGNKYRYPSTDFYTNDFLRSHTNTVNVNGEFTGGDEKTQYYVNMGWKYDQALAKINPDANTGSNQFNLRGNIDFKINDWMSSSIDGVALLNSNKQALSNLLNAGTSFKPHLYAPLLPVSLIDTVGNPQLAAIVRGANQYGGMLIGSTSQFDKGPLAEALAGGYKKTIFRSTQFNNAIDFDLNKITEGLTAKTYLSFDFYDSYNININNDYRTYQPIDWSDDDLIIELKENGDPDRKDQTENVSSNGFVSRLGFYGLLNYQKDLNEDHSINSTLLGYVNNHKTSGVIQPNNSAHLGFQLGYSYKNKLLADFSSAYVHSNKLPEGNRGGFSPTFGLGYILSEEYFMKGIDFVDFLKLKASAGVIKSDIGIGSYYSYAETYNIRGNNFTWGDGNNNRLTNFEQGANSNMGFEERVDLNIGFESYLLNSLWVEFNLFQTDIDKQLTKLNTIYASYYNTFKPFDNYNKDRYKGFELGVNYKKSFNDVTVNIGANIMHSTSEILKRDEVYEDDYQYRTGKSRSAIWGLEDDGFYSMEDFKTDEFGALLYDKGAAVLKDNLDKPAYGGVIPGDIKYVDQNGDGVINNNDKKVIGERSNPWSYGLNVRLKYKGWSLFVIGSGQFGGEATLSGNYYWVDGNDKYSEVVKGRWTEETANTATYPRLSAKNDSHNYQTSTFWMYKNSFFNVQRAQLTYEFSRDFCQKIRMNSLSVNVSGRNLLQISENKDIRQLNIGGNPEFRTFTFGLRTSF